MRRLRLALLFTIATSLFAQSTAPAPSPPKTVVLPNGHIRVSSGTMAQLLIDRPDPVIYPSGACDGYRSCSAVLHIVISKTGTVEEATPVNGPPRLSAAVVDAVKTWTYKPYLLDGEPREVETTVAMSFNIGRPADSVPPSAHRGS